MNNKGVHNIYRYWGKVNSSEEGTTDYHLLEYHCLDVAAVGEVLLENQPALLQQFRDLSGVD